MKHTLIAALFLLLLLPLTFGADITGWGSPFVFGGDVIPSTFDVGYTTSITPNRTSTINFGTMSEAVVCNIDASTPANELVLYQGNSVQIYTGRGNTMTFLYSYDTEYTILDVGCLNNYLYVGDSGNIYTLTMYGETTNVSTITSAGYDIECNYEKGLCAINDGFGVYMTESQPSVSNYYEYPSFTIDESYVFGIADEYSIYYAPQTTMGGTGATVGLYTYNIVTQNLTSYNRTVSYNSGQSSVQYTFGDINGDGSNEMCSLTIVYLFSTNTRQAFADCINDLGTSLINQGIGVTSASAYTNNGISIYDKNEDGINDFCFGVYHPTYPFTRCYDYTNSQVFSSSSSIRMGGSYLTFGAGSYDYHKFSVFQPYNDSEDYYLSNNVLYRKTTSTPIVNQTLSFFNTPSTTIVADISGDGTLELINTIDGETIIAFKNDVNEYEVPPTLTFAGNTQNGGFFGYYVGDTCPETFVTFQALECIGDLTACTYYNDNVEKERLYVNCGNGLYSTGAFSNANPQATCYYNATEDDFQAIIYIQGESNPDSLRVNNANIPINITVVNSTTCNGQLLSQPPMTNTPVDSGEVQPPTTPIDVPTDTETPTDVSGLPSILGSVQSNIKLIMALILIIGVVSTMAAQGIRNPIILLFGAIVGLILTNVLGLVSTAYLVLMIVVILGLFLLSITVFKTQTA